VNKSRTRIGAATAVVAAAAASSVDAARIMSVPTIKAPGLK
jgi:hypothetical protein